MFKRFIYLVLLLAFGSCAQAQDAQELAAERAAAQKLKGEHPVAALMRGKHSQLKPALQNVHPRVYMTGQDLAALREKAKAQPELWQTALNRVRALTVEPPPPPAEARRVQNEIGLGIAEAAFVYKITGEQKYLEAARKYMDAAVSYNIWGYSYNKPDVDLAAGHLLYGMGWAYDLLYHDLTPQERDKYRAKLIRQARLMFNYFKPKSGKTYAYSQNHTFIPLAGLAVTAYALYDETDEAKQWAALARAVFDRVLATYSDDGYYYEGMEYWIFSTPWLAHYLDAHLHATGENLYLSTPGLRQSHTYVAHATLPGGEFNFDFGDIYAGNVTRSRQGEDYQRERLNGHFRSNYNILYRLADVYQNPAAQGVAAWLKSKGQVNAEEFWTFIWYNPQLKPQPITKQLRWHYFPDHEVAYWRSGWDDDATAFAFKCGPPEGHAANEKLKQFPEWRLSSGHAHPDAASLILWSRGKYLTGDSGYAGVPLTEHHNTLVFDGRGQGLEGKGHDAFAGVPYHRLNRIRLTATSFSARQVSLTADAAAAYEPEIGVRRFIRQLTFTAPGSFTVTDEVVTDKPSRPTFFWHADNSIAPLKGNSFRLETGPSLELTIQSPANPATRIETNFLTAPGRPGAVDQGPREERGLRLAVTSPSPVRQTKFVTRLTINP